MKITKEQVRTALAEMFGIEYGMIEDVDIRYCSLDSATSEDIQIGSEGMLYFKINGRWLKLWTSEWGGLEFVERSSE
jgi:regulatory protein YycH of two-component signal transduction system YycFG